MENKEPKEDKIEYVEYSPEILPITTENLPNEFLYGKSIEALDYETQIRNKPAAGGSVSMKIGHFTITATGDKVITGVGFQPTKINIIANVNGSNGILRSNGWYDTSTYCSYDYMTNTGQKSYYSTNQIVLIDDGSSGSFVSTYASFTSFDSDGFTLNTSIQNQTVQCIYIAYE